MKTKFFIFIIVLLTYFPYAYGNNISKVRIGLHPDKTRFVVNLHKQVRYRLLKKGTLTQYDMILFNSSIEPQLLKSHKGNGIIKSYTFKKEGKKNIILSLQTNKNAQVEKIFSMQRGKSFPLRLVIDLKEKRTKTVSPLQDLSHQLDIPQPLMKPLKRVVVIDAGHGGQDPGTISRNGVQEKNITLAIAKMIKKEIEKQGKYIPVLTRSNDKYVPLRERFAIARKNQANLLISLHADSNIDKSVKGLAMYTLSGNASDKEAERLALKENASDFLSDLNFTQESEPEVKNILIDLSQTRTRNLSLKFCKNLMKKFTKEEVLSNNTHRSADFAVLKAPDVASVLIELGYLSNQEDHKRLANKTHQRKVALKIAQAIDDYFEHIKK